ncbi:hypothetical protein AHF37_10660 [Paragonimus kellicotti]|nr:hypothetical protein AHF37_10660 [Paragonimus kellicotti]
MAISVVESKPTYEGSNDQGRSSDCVYCQRFGSAAQRCGHNPPLRFPRSRGYWPPFRGTSRGSIAPRGSPELVIVSTAEPVASVCVLWKVEDGHSRPKRPELASLAQWREHVWNLQSTKCPLQRLYTAFSRFYLHR